MRSKTNDNAKNDHDTLENSWIEGPSRKELVGRIAARIRSFRPPEPYQGKGIRYTGEKIREKAGKSGK